MFQGIKLYLVQIHFKSIQTTSNIFGLLRESILLVFSNKGTKAFPRKDACLHCKWLATISWNAPADVSYYFCIHWI